MQLARLKRRSNRVDASFHANIRTYLMLGASGKEPPERAAQQESLNVGHLGHTFDSERNLDGRQALKNESGRPLKTRQDRNGCVK